MLRKTLTVLLLTILLSCSSTKTIKFSDRDNQIFTTSSLTEFLEQNIKPKVVLRVNDPLTGTVSSEENSDYLYNIIENQLLKSGFIVRDRHLFNQIVTNDENNVDYAKLSSVSDTDLIIELVKIDPAIVYETNRYYDSRNRERTLSGLPHQEYGASVEFKVISIKTNEFAGSYKFNYSPCTSGCVVSLSAKDLRKIRKEAQKDEEKPYEGVEKDELQNFIEYATKMLVAEMRS